MLWKRIGRTNWWMIQVYPYETQLHSQDLSRVLMNGYQENY